MQLKYSNLHDQEQEAEWKCNQEKKWAVPQLLTGGGSVESDPWERGSTWTRCRITPIIHFIPSFFTA